MTTARPRDEAVSSVLGAVLMLPILISTMLMIQTQFVPVWDEDREARHADVVANQVGFLKGELDRLSISGNQAPVTGHLDLRTEQASFNFFSSYSLGGAASFDPLKGEVDLEAPHFTVQRTGSTSLLGVDETWDAVVNGVEIGPIDSLLHLRVRVENPHALDAGISATLDLKDADGDYAGRLRIRNGQDAVYVSTYGASSQVDPLTNRLDDTDPDGPTFYFNLLDDNLLFDAVVAAAKKPVTLELTDGGLPADFTIVYDRNTPTGVERIGSDAGVTFPDYNVSVPAGAMSINVRNQAYVDQTYVLEHGAVILDQGNGAAMSAPPSFKATRGSVQDTIHWSIPTLSGVRSSVGTAQATVTLTPAAGGVSLSGLAPSFSVRLPTDYPGLWASFWTRELATAGYNATAGEYTVFLTSNSATLTVFGPVSDPVSTTNDIVLDIDLTPVNLRLSPFS